MKPQGTPIGRKLAMTSKAVGSAFNSALAAEGGSVPVWLILNALREGRWTTQLDLARAVGIEGPTLTRHLDNLEQSGFVVRQPSETDRRAVRVEITEAGEAAHERMLVAVIAFNKRLWSGLTRDDLRLFDEILTRLEGNLGTPLSSAVPRRR
jgi:MarR family transcriptional regulator, transcriptional regulator for hemolysin